MHRCNIALWGATGVMGRQVITAAEKFKSKGIDLQVVVAFAAADDPLQGTVLPGVKQPLKAAWSTDIRDVNVIIDFSSPAGTEQALTAALAHKLPLLVCATGHTEAQLQKLDAATGDVPLIHARNTSIGVNATLQLVEQATRLLGVSADIEISEIHHTRKKDSPSGTARAFGDAVAAARGVTLDEVAVYGRVGNDLSYSKGEVGMSAIRGGDTIGEHTVYFFLENERIEITHRAFNRSIWAEGAVRAAQWLVGKSPGRYSMDDVISS